MNRTAIIGCIIPCLAWNVYAMDIERITCATDRLEYKQGESVVIKVTNNSSEDIILCDRIYIDGGFAVIERKTYGEAWKPIELFAVANIITTKALKPGEYHTYTWNTKGYNRSDTLALPGLYRIIFQERIISNHFVIKKI
jgi:hypothetical protein